MAKLEQYRSYIEQLIKAHSHYQPSFGEVTGYSVEVKLAAQSPLYTSF